MNIPIFRLKYEEGFKDKFAEGCREILSSGWIGEGEKTERFESEFAKFIGAKYAVATSSGTAALEVALRSIGVKGKKVVVPDNTFIATPIAVDRAGGIPLLVDIEIETFSLHPDKLDAALKNNNVAAVIIVHIGGLISAHIDTILSVCNKWHVPIVEDAAHAHGSYCYTEHAHHKAGCIGDAAAFSFFPTKVMTTGRGGIVTTNREDLYNEARSVKTFGKKDGEYSRDGASLEVTEFQALLGLMELERVTYRLSRRRDLARIYYNSLDGSGFYPVARRGSSYYKQIAIIPNNTDRDKLRDYCVSHGVSLTGEVYNKPIHKQKGFENMTGWFPNSNYFCGHHICPPLYPELSEEEVRYVCEVLLDYEIS